MILRDASIAIRFSVDTSSFFDGLGSPIFAFKKLFGHSRCKLIQQPREPCRLLTPCTIDLHFFYLLHKRLCYNFPGKPISTISFVVAVIALFWDVFLMSVLSAIK